MRETGSIGILLLFIALAVLGSYALGFFIGKYGSVREIPQSSIAEEVSKQVDKKLSEISTPQPVAPSATTAAQLQPIEENLKNIRSTKELADISASVIKNELAENPDVIPSVEFLSNDGEQATVSVHYASEGEGILSFLVKRNNQWIVVYKGKGIGSCVQIKPIRQKYTLNSEFLPCQEEIGE